MHILDTGRLRLRTVEPDDTAFYLALVNDPAFIEHIGDRGIHTLDDAREALLAGPIAMQEARGHSLYVVELKEGRVPIGMCGLIKRDSLDGIDIGYAFLPAWRGQGYAYEAGVAVLGFAHTVGEFGVVLMIGGNIPDKTRVVSVQIYDHVEAMEYAQAHWLAGAMLVFSFLVLLALYARGHAKARWS